MRASSREEGEWSADGGTATPHLQALWSEGLLQWCAGAGPQSPCAPFLLVGDIGRQLEISRSGNADTSEVS